ncbi:NADH:ubiquinone oxidoreductase [Umbelopsis sp. WA50703]
MAVDMSSRYMSFNNMQDELDYWRNHAENLENTLSETRAALDEFQVSSRELEEELEKELQSTEKVCGDLKSRCEQLKRESEDWKSKYTESKHEHNNVMTQMQREIDVLRATEQTFRKKTLELELDNDDLERTERAAQSSLADIEMKYNKAIERNAILEQEITTKDQLAEQVQRLKDDLNDVNHELSVLQDKHSRLDEANQELESKLSSSEKQNTELNSKLQQQLTRSPSSRASTPDRTSGYYEPTLSRMPTHRSRIPRTSGIPGASNIGNSSTYTGNSNPVKMVQDMVGRVRKLDYSHVEVLLPPCSILHHPIVRLYQLQQLVAKILSHLVTDQSHQRTILMDEPAVRYNLQTTSTGVRPSMYACLQWIQLKTGRRLCGVDLVENVSTQHLVVNLRACSIQLCIDCPMLPIIPFYPLLGSLDGFNG